MVVLTFRKGRIDLEKDVQESFTPRLDDIAPVFSLPVLRTQAIPDEIVLSEEIEDRQLLQQTLQEKKKGRVRVLGPSDRVRRHGPARRREPARDRDVPLDEAFRKTLHLTKAPKRIEVYDISHTHGRARRA